MKIKNCINKSHFNTISCDKKTGTSNLSISTLSIIQLNECGFIEMSDLMCNKILKVRNSCVGVKFFLHAKAVPKLIGN